MSTNKILGFVFLKSLRRLDSTVKYSMQKKGVFEAGNVEPCTCCSTG